ncbi:Hypothetical protein GbCGDNIH7_7202 [Granulibacter bethesdensis]|nr:Hypothetical protein GbCGDNIH7_7202 [Granulibacter bethesdensis]
MSDVNFQNQSIPELKIPVRVLNHSLNSSHKFETVSTVRVQTMKKFKSSLAGDRQGCND